MSTSHPKPIFIIGAPRSGTSITTWALGQHPNIQPMPETAWLATYAVAGVMSFLKGSERGTYSHLSNVEYPLERFMAHLGRGADDIVHDAFEMRCRRFYGDYEGAGTLSFNTEKPGKMHIRRHSADPKRRWIDGTPFNTEFVWGLRLLFPDAQFLHLVRRPESVATSLMNFENVGARSKPPRDALKTWVQHTRFALLAQKAYGHEIVKTVRYEDLTTKTDESLANILNFLGEEPCEDCAIPFEKRINSSDVDGERDKMAAKVKSLRRFPAAEALYQEAITPEPSKEASERAAAKMEECFMEYVRRSQSI